MRELAHKHLFDPPEGTCAVVVPVPGTAAQDTQGKWKTPCRAGYAKAAALRWPGLAEVVGTLHHHRGVTPHSLTIEREGKIGFPRLAPTALPKFHIISLPVRMADGIEISSDWLSHQFRALALLCDGRVPWLASGLIVCPQIRDESEGRGWAHWRKFADIWLSDDRFVFVDGLGHIS